MSRVRLIQEKARTPPPLVLLVVALLRLLLLTHGCGSHVPFCGWSDWLPSAWPTTTAKKKKKRAVHWHVQRLMYTRYFRYRSMKYFVPGTADKRFRCKIYLVQQSNLAHWTSINTSRATEELVPATLDEEDDDGLGWVGWRIMLGCAPLASLR